MDIKKEFKDGLSFKDSSNKFGLHGYVKVEVEDPETKKRSLWYENDNIIPISGMQWVLMKMFGLHLDSVHDPAISYEDLGQDTSTVIPDLNSSRPAGLGIGKDPKAATDEGGYTPMEGDISADHFIQGFIVGNGGTGEDSISTKNTDYSYYKLRQPIPFQQTSGTLDPTIAGKYLGLYRESGDNKKYYIKKFDERAHIYHNWWRDGQKWDYIDPITPDDLGPGNNSTTPKTNRIETYAEVTMSIDTKEGDCLGYFQNNANTQSAVINELGLVAFDTVPGSRSILEKLYETRIKRFLNLIYDIPELVDSTLPEEYVQELKDVATEIKNVKANGGKIALVGGPAIVHTGSAGIVAQLIKEGFIDVIFAGNALATHDIECDQFGTSLGVNVKTGEVVAHGHTHHMRAINRINNSGSIKEAVEDGTLKSGIMYECIKNDVPFVLAGSIRDDGPLPDVITDTVESQKLMRKYAQEVDMVIMISTMLHSIATGNLLPSRVKSICVDINPSTVTKLADRGSAQVVGIVTDVGAFLPVLYNALHD